MPYKISWYEDKRITLLEFSGLLTLEDAAAGFQHNLEFQESGTPMIHLIIDTTDIEKPDFPLRKLLDVITPAHPNVGWRVIVANDMLIRFFATIAAQSIGIRFRFVKTLDEALDFLADVDDTLELQRR